MPAAHCEGGAFGHGAAETDGEEEALGMPTGPISEEIKARNYRADKARTRRIGEKLVRLLDKPLKAQRDLVSPEWLERIASIPAEVIRT